VEKQTLTDGFPTGNDRVTDAAKWLAEHRSECAARIIPVLKERFGLCNREAIEAVKLAHEFDMQEAHHG
jgi:hypothetical protein